MYYAIPVNDNGRDDAGTDGVIYGDYPSARKLIRYNRKYFKPEQLYSVYVSRGEGNFKFLGFHSDLPFDEHVEWANRARDAELRS